jgi:hypothetical protein
MVRRSCLKMGKMHHMNIFYVLWFYHLYPQSEHPIHDYLKSVFPFTKMQPFTDVMQKQKKQYDITSIYGNILLNDYGLWLTKRKYSVFVVYTPIRNKYQLLNQVFHNILLSESQKQAFLTAFSTIQKNYMALSRFVYLYKYKKSKPAITTDLYFNELNEKSRDVFVLYQNWTIYYFRIKEIMRVIENALIKESYDCTCIMCEDPTNPYNREKFTQCDLYNLYFYMKFSNIITIPQLFYCFFLSGFYMPVFIRKYGDYIQKLSIRKFVFQHELCSKYVQDDIYCLIYEFLGIRKITIDEGFPKDVLMEAFRPFLYVYYLIIFANINKTQMKFYESWMYKYLIKFYEYNKSFGRKYIVVKRESKFTREFIGKDDKLNDEKYYTDYLKVNSWNL